MAVAISRGELTPGGINTPVNHINLKTIWIIFDQNAGVFIVAKQIHQLDVGDFKEYKLHNHPVGACLIIITIDKKDNKIQERKRLRPLFYCLVAQNTMNQNP